MQFTEAERRFLHREHGEVRLGNLLTVDEFIAINCPPEMAERIVARELEKRAKKLGPKFDAFRKRQPAAQASDDLAGRIAAADLF
jgi:hypothetical protein